MIEAIFFDRDGTLGGTGTFVHPKDFSLYDETIKALALLEAYEVLKFGFTNQHRIATGEVTLEAIKTEFSNMGFDHVYVCPHDLLNDNCDCKKPKVGLLKKAEKDYGLNLKQCVVIGDIGTDMIAADRVGAIKIIVKTGLGNSSLTTYRELWADVSPDYVAEHILDGVQWLINHYEIRGKRDEEEVIL